MTTKIEAERRRMVEQLCARRAANRVRLEARAAAGDTFAIWKLRAYAQQQAAEQRAEAEQRERDRRERDRLRRLLDLGERQRGPLAFKKTDLKRALDVSGGRDVRIDRQTGDIVIEKERHEPDAEPVETSETLRRLI